MVNRRTFMLQALGTAAMAVAPRWAGAFVHPIDEPAMRSRQAARSPLLAVTGAGRRFVAVGIRGQAVLSDDGGRTWAQATVPVSSDLVAVSFPTEKTGWAVGHGGVVLNSADGGVTWVKQFDGRQASQVAIEYLEKHAKEGPAMEQLLADEKLLVDSGGTQPFLDVHFINEHTGYVVGTFNRIFRTDDGGATWLPLMDRTDNPKGLHFNAIASRGGNVYLAGEQGTVWRLDQGSGRFLAFPTPYIGTLFGLLLVSSTTLLTFGMRGSVFRSDDAGVTWKRVAVASLAGITSGVVMPDGIVVLVTQAGALEVSRDQGRTFVAAKPAQPMSYYGVSAGAPGQLILAGAEGMRVETVR